MSDILNLNNNDNYNDWGILRTAKQKSVKLDKTIKEFDVYKIPIDILVYNPKNGRMFMEAKRFENEQHENLVELKNQDPTKYNDEVEYLIWLTNEERNLSTKRDIEKYGQIMPGVVLGDGTIVDGNRRFTCLRRLHREKPDDERFKYFLAAIIKVDGHQITEKQLKEYELRETFGHDEQVGYSVINKNMSIYWLIEKEKYFDYSSMAELLGEGTTPGMVSKICKTCQLVDEFLEYIRKPGEYQIAEDLKIYWPLDPLASYFMNDGRSLTDLEKLERKHLFFDYLLTLDVGLTTQNLRDGLIKKVFKDNAETRKLIDEHKETIGDKIHAIIDESKDVDSFNESIKELRNSDEASDDKENYEKSVSKQVAKNQIDVPLKECKNALKCIENINIKPLVNASNPIADQKLLDVKNALSEIENKVKNLILEIENPSE